MDQASHDISENSFVDMSDLGKAVAGQQARGSTLLVSKIDNIPELRYAEYGYAWTWSTDLFSLPHNAIKLQLKDLFEVFGTVRGGGNRLDKSQGDDLALIWKATFDFIVDYFLLEEEFCYPFVENRQNIADSSQDERVGNTSTDPLCPQKSSRNLGLVDDLRREGCTVAREFLELDEIFQKLSTVPSEKQLPLIYGALVAWAPSLISYFDEQEKTLPFEIEAQYVEEDKYALDKRIFGWMLKKPNHALNVVLISRWITPKETHQQWVKENIPVTHLVGHARWQSAFQGGYLKRLNRLLEQKTAMKLAVDDGVSAAAISLPVLVLCEYGFEWHWSRDPFAMANNAIRRELMDMFIIFDFLRRNTKAMHSKDIAEFHKWFVVFKSFFEVDIMMIEKLLLPWVCIPAIKEQNQPFLTTFNKILNGLHEVNAMFAEFDSAVFSFSQKQDGATFLHMLRVATAFAPFCNAYFDRMEKSIPILVEQYRVIEEKDAIEKEMCEFIMKQPNASTNIIMLSRWVADKDVLHEWMMFNLRKRAKLQYKSWTKQFTEGHRKIVEDFFSKSRAMTKGQVATRKAAIIEGSPLTSPVSSKGPWWNAITPRKGDESNLSTPNGWAN